MANSKRSGKFYRQNEGEVMWQLGLEPTKNSGAGWVEKEDGQSESIICQLKSTDANSIRITKHDLDTLEYNAGVAHKIPVFAIQFLESGSLYLVLRPEVLQDVYYQLQDSNYYKKHQNAFDLGIDTEIKNKRTVLPTRTIKSSDSARMQVRKEIQKKFNKRSKSAL